jgi:hypothetical protein
MRYHIPTLMKRVETAIKTGKPVNPADVAILDAWWSKRK